MDKKNIDSSLVTKITLIAIAVIAVGIAFFAYRYFNGERTKLEKANQERGTYLKELEGMQAQRQVKELETANLNEMTAEYLSKYPSQLSNAKAIQNVYDIVKAADIEVTGISPVFDVVYYEPATPAPVQTTSPEGEGTEAATPAPTLTPNTSEAPSLVSDKKEEKIGLKTTMKLSFSASYEQLRTVIDFIKNHENKMTVNDVSVQFDSGNGKLAVNMEMNMYSYTEGTAPYEEPTVEDVGISKEVLFSTVN